MAYPGGWDDGKGGYAGYEEQWPDEEETFSKTQANIDKVIIVLGLALCGGLCGPLLAEVGWNEKSTHIWTLYFGLQTMTTKLDTLAGAAMQAAAASRDALKKSSIDAGNSVSLAKMLSPSEPHSVQFMRDQFCNAQLWTFGLLGNMCEIFSYLLYASWACMLGHVIAIVMILFGSMLMCMKPKKCPRWSAMLCYTIAALALGGCLTAYCAVSMLLKDLFVPEGLSNPEFTLSICAVLSGGLTLLVLILPIMLFTMGRFPRTFTKDPYGDPYADDMYGGGGGYDPYGGKGFDDGKGGWDDGKGGGKW